METTIIISIIISLIIINIAATVLLILRVKTVLLNRTDNLANNLSNGLRYNLSNLATAVRRRGSDTSDTLIKMIKHLNSISATIQTLSENVNSIAIDIKNITTKQSATNIALDDLTKDVFLNDTYPTIIDISERVSTHSKSLEAIIKSTIINNRKLDDVIDFINDFQAADKDLKSKASKASDEEPIFVGGVIKPRSIKEDKDDRDVDNDSDANKAKEEKWLTDELLDSLEYVDASNPRGSCRRCALSAVCNDLGLMDKVAKGEDVRIRTKDIVRRCLDLKGYYIKKDKEKSNADKAKELIEKLKTKVKSDRSGSAESNNK